MQTAETGLLRVDRAAKAGHAMAEDMGVNRGRLNIAGAQQPIECSDIKEAVNLCTSAQ